MRKWVLDMVPPPSSLISIHIHLTPLMHHSGSFLSILR